MTPLEAEITWIDAVRFVAESGSGHSVVIDGPPDQGGRNVGARPMEMMLMGLGGCTAFDIVDILRKSRQQIDDCRVRLTAERANEVPAVFTRIHIHYHLKGRALSDKHVKRAIDLTAEKYCSASIMLARAGVEITHDYTIEATEAETGA